MDQDDKVCLIVAELGEIAYGRLLKLLAAIYHEGYYKYWNEEVEMLFAARKNIPIDQVINLVKTAINRGFLEINLYKTYGILTSSGIQKRYINAAKERKRIVIEEKFLLVDLEDFTDSIKSKITLVNTDLMPINSDRTLVFPESIPKGKERKVEERRLGEILPETAIANRPIYHLIESAFISQAPQVGDNVEFNYSREGPHIKELEGKALARDGPEEFAKTVIVVFWQLIHSSDQFWKKQPFLPSVLNSGGIWPRVLKEMENHREEQLDDKLQEIIGGLKF